MSFLSLAALVASIALVTAPATALAVVAPDSGDPSGGTAITFEGIHFIQVEAGANFSLGLTSEGTVFAWGDNGSGQLGNGTTTFSDTPVQVLGVDGRGLLTGVTSIAAGSGHALALTPTGVLAWGYNSYGQLGDGSNADSSSPVNVLGVGEAAGGNTLTGVTSIAAGENFSLALTPTGVLAWGYNDDGVLGDGTNTDSSSPVNVLGVGQTAGGTTLTGVTSIAAGFGHALALTPTGVLAWGYNDDGELGDGSWDNRSSPVNVLGVGQATGGTTLTGVTSIAAGGYHSLALTPTGVLAWGFNGFGQLGDGSNGGYERAPVHVLAIGGVAGDGSTLTGVTSIAAGGYHSLALTSTGVLAWGNNSVGELGNGSNDDQESAPVHVLAIGGVAGDRSTLTGVTSIAAGENFSLALTLNGVLGWGGNDDAQLGVGEGNSSSTFAPVLGVRFQPLTATFAGVAGTGLGNSGITWNVTSPAGNDGVAAVLATASLFAGTTPATPATVSWNAGTFTYLTAPPATPSAPAAPAEIAKTGLSLAPLPLSATVLALGLGLFALTAHRRRIKNLTKPASSRTTD